MLSNKQNQENFKARQTAKGRKRREYWLKPEQVPVVDKFVKDLNG